MVESPPLPPHDEPNDEVGIKRMLAELAFPAGHWRPQLRELEERFIQALDPLLKLFCTVGGMGEGEQTFAVRQNISRVMSDLVATVHLITHGYFNQAYGTMRTAYETLDLLELVAQNVEQAKLWVNTEAGHVDFQPGRVRERLGKDRYDEVYSQLSELSHPRFAASKLGSFGKRQEGTDELTVVVRIGPFLLDGADPWLAAGLLVPLIGSLSVRMHQLAESGAVTEEAYLTSLNQSHRANVELGKFIGAELDALGLDSTEFVADLEAAPKLAVDDSDAESQRRGDK